MIQNHLAWQPCQCHTGRGDAGRLDASSWASSLIEWSGGEVGTPSSSVGINPRGISLPLLPAPFLWHLALLHATINCQ